MANWIVKLITFGGKSDEDVEEWTDRLDNIGVVNAWNDARILAIAPIQLTGAALRWYKEANSQNAFTHWHTPGQGNVILKT